MAAGIFSLIKSLFKPAAELVNNIHTSQEEKMTLINELAGLEFKMQEKILEYETKILETKSSIIVAEAKGESWLQRSWRPITMLTFLVLIICNSFGWFQVELPDRIWTLLELGLGGYVVGRSLEKIAPQFKDLIKKPKEKIQRIRTDRKE